MERRIMSEQDAHTNASGGSVPSCSRRCEGGYYIFGDATDGMKPPQAACPSCGRTIAFHWATGRFHHHNKPEEEAE